MQYMDLTRRGHRCLTIVLLYCKDQGLESGIMGNQLRLVVHFKSAHIRTYFMQVRFTLIPYGFAVDIADCQHVCMFFLLNKKFYYKMSFWDLFLFPVTSYGIDLCRVYL